MLVASIANVMQATDRARTMPVPTMLAWGMLYGAIADAGFAWATAGPPVIDGSAGYMLGVLYLGLFASALAFPLYFGVIQAIGPGAGGLFERARAGPRDDAVDAVRRLCVEPAGGGGRGAGARRARHCAAGAAWRLRARRPARKSG